MKNDIASLIHKILEKNKAVFEKLAKHKNPEALDLECCEEPSEDSSV